MVEQNNNNYIVLKLWLCFGVTREIYIFVIKMIARVIKVKNSCGQYGPAAPFTQALLDTVVEAKFNPPRLERRSQ